MLIEIAIIGINTFLSTRYKFTNASLIEFRASGVDELFEGIFYGSFVDENFLLEKAVQMLEKVVLGE